MKVLTPNEKADRIMQLLDVAFDQVQAGDGEMTLMALDECLKVAQSIPKKQLLTEEK